MRAFPRFKRIDEGLLFSFLALVIIGLVMIYSTSSMMAESRFGSHLLFLRNQFIWTLVSIVAMLIIVKLNLERLAIYSAPLLFVVLGLLAVVFAMPTVNGAHRWIMLGFMSVQPSELFKFLIIIYLAFSLSNPKRNIADWKQLIYPYAPLIGTGLVLILLEPNLGMVIVLSLTVLGMLFLAGIRVKYLMMAFLPLISVASFVIFVLGYKKARILDYIAAVNDPLQGSYQVKQAALTLGSGGILGTGIGDGRQKLFFLPYPHTDFVFAAIGEEVGLLGLMFIVALFFFILWRGLKIASGQPDRFGFLLAAGVTLSLFISIMINLGVVTSLVPVTGLPLPFLSYGGSSLLMSSCMIAVLLNLSRRVVKE